ncbi:MAG TPA: squalene/phytoene synthase family protein [Hyphomicrobiaceae bacterium]|nr:squalene/phytoene synthase family protein [Hyphomicrobiaceae bacterium]
MDQALSAAQRDAVAASARTGEPDRYLAALLAPPSARPHLLALAAFLSELGCLPARVTREPAMGQIRLQWWREAIAAAEGVRTGNPVADALRTAIRACHWPTAVLVEAIDAHELDLARHGLADDGALAAYLWRSEGAPFALAAGILSGGTQSDPQPAAAASAQAYGLARLLMGLPNALAHGRVPLPQSRLAALHVSSAELLSGADGAEVATLLGNLCEEASEALARSRTEVANLPRAMWPAFLPLALVGTYLRALEGGARSILRSPPQVTPLKRITRIAVAHWFGRF